MTLAYTIGQTVEIGCIDEQEDVLVINVEEQLLRTRET